MAQKWNLQDIVPPGRVRKAKAPQGGVVPGRAVHAPRDMRDMRREEARQSQKQQGMQGQEAYRADVHPHEEHYDAGDASIVHLEVTDGRLARVRRFIFFGVAVAVVAFLGFSITILMSGATVTVTPKSHQTTVQTTVEASLKPQVGKLGYELLTLKEEGGRQVPTTGKEDVKERASGSIMVFNAFNTTPQRLIKNTRFESPTGLIYHIEDSIVVPGYTKDAAGTIIPGSVSAKVFADGTGETYNIRSLRLTIPGLKGSAQYDSMYAEADATGLSGGFEGTKLIIDENELATARQQIQTELSDKLLARIKTERPNGFILYDSAIRFGYESLPATNAGGEAVLLKERAYLYVPLFNESTFASFIAKNTYPSYSDEPVRIAKPDDITFAYDLDPLEDISKREDISFTLSGPVQIVWMFDADALKKDLVGLAEKALPTVLTSYPAIDRADAVMRPIWKRTFPADLEDITVTEIIP